MSLASKETVAEATLVGVSIPPHYVDGHVWKCPECCDAESNLCTLPVIDTLTGRQIDR
jgi:hypothetical protein